jgi:hypothetical protein
MILLYVWVLHTQWHSVQFYVPKDLYVQLYPCDNPKSYMYLLFAAPRDVHMLLAAPRGVLMYFTELEGNVKSFNYSPLISDSKWRVQIIRALMVHVRVTENGTVPYHACKSNAEQYCAVLCIYK